MERAPGHHGPRHAHDRRGHRRPRRRVRPRRTPRPTAPAPQPVARGRGQRAPSARRPSGPDGARLGGGSRRLPFAVGSAVAADFASVRQFNDTIKIFACTPTELRRRRRLGSGPSADTLSLRLALRLPLTPGALAFLARRAIPRWNRRPRARSPRTLTLPHGAGVVELTADGGTVHAPARPGPQPARPDPGNWPGAC